MLVGNSDAHLLLHAFPTGSGRICAVGFDEGSEKLHAMLHVCNLQFSFVEFQTEFREQELAYLRYDGLEPCAVMGHEVGIIDIAAIVPCLQHTLAVLVKFIEIDIREELRGKVADGKSAVGCCLEQTLVIRQAVPVVSVAKNDTSIQGVEVQYDIEKVDFEGIRMDTAVAQLPEFLSVDVHEVALDVYLQHIALALIAVALKGCGDVAVRCRSECPCP